MKKAKWGRREDDDDRYDSTTSTSSRYDDDWYRFRHVMYLLHESLGLYVNIARNARMQAFRKMGWTDVVKHADRDQIEEFLQDYLYPIQAEFKMITELWEEEKQQRERDGV